MKVLLSMVVVSCLSLLSASALADCPEGRLILCDDGVYTDQLESEGDVDWWQVTTTCEGTLNWRIHSQSGGPWLHFWGYHNPGQCDDYPMTEGIVLPDSTEELGQYYPQPRP
ncbi:MAG: hypothetical protein JXO22_13515, partial [Phycisphaerae bacterium]|nr:hypothetical protein [Phycisphaerae bacterium]